MKIDQKLAEAIVGLEHLPGFKHFVAQLRVDLVEADAACRSYDAPMVYRAQGKAHAFSSVLECVDTAREFLGRTPRH